MSEVVILPVCLRELIPRGMGKDRENRTCVSLTERGFALQLYQKHFPTAVFSFHCWEAAFSDFRTGRPSLFCFSNLAFDAHQTGHDVHSSSMAHTMSCTASTVVRTTWWIFIHPWPWSSLDYLGPVPVGQPNPPQQADVERQWRLGPIYTVP